MRWTAASRGETACDQPLPRWLLIALGSWGRPSTVTEAPGWLGWLGCEGGALGLELHGL